jgi:hypothetical protein
MQATLFLSLLAGAAADCYLQYPPGSNNRLDEGGGNRNNNNRLMDTQNNAKGGYGYGGDAGNKADPLKYMVGSELTTMWTSQHSCGSANNECQIVVQAMCNPVGATPQGVPVDTNANSVGEGPVRDGTDNGTPDPNNPDADTGLHEPASFYSDCAARDRNKGLYTADQNMNNGAGAVATRQNPNGNRSGQECSEERDYYPYWHPSPWKDLAVLTNNLALCDYYKQESQNVKAKNYCSNPQYNNEQACTGNGDTWQTQPAFGIPPPECIAAPVQRDNHLGNGPIGQEVQFNWTVSSAMGINGADDAEDCVMRFRYNITTADTMVCEDKAINTRQACEAAGKIWSSLYLDESYNNNVDGGQNNGDGNDLQANGNQDPPLLKQDPDSDMGGFLKDTGGTDSYLELAVNTNQYGRTFQDRTHVMAIQARPPQVGASTKIYNLNVKGKRGNIVQTYPATEYDFTPVDLVVGTNDMVHVQWTGNDNTNNNGNNNGEGTDNEDRHNIVQLDRSGMDSPAPFGSGPGADGKFPADSRLAGQTAMFDVAWEWNPDTSADFGGARDVKALTHQMALAKQTGCDDNPNDDQAADNCQKLNAAAATVDLGMMKFKPGEYKYMSSRNMNFSNRAQKAKLQVTDKTSVVPKQPVAVTVTPTGGSENAKSLKVTWSSPGARDAYVGIDEKEYWGMQQTNTPVVDYKVSYSINGGEEWIAAGTECSGLTMQCEITGLPAGTPVAVMVQAGGSAGFGDYSDPVFARTEHSEASKEAEAKLLAMADGTYISPGAITAIVFGVLAGCLLCAGIAFVFNKKCQPPPPPPGMSKVPPPAPGY